MGACNDSEVPEKSRFPAHIFQDSSCYSLRITACFCLTIPHISKSAGTSFASQSTEGTPQSWKTDIKAPQSKTQVLLRGYNNASGVYAYKSHIDLTD